MKRRMIAALFALAFVGCSAMAVFTAMDMGRTWGTGATCTIGSSASPDLPLLTALHPDIGWTAYAQSAQQEIRSEALPGRAAEAAVLSFLGAPERIAFFPVRSGRLPLDGERGVCALDVDTAFRLFGSIDPDGESVRLNGKPARVVGVIDVDRPLVLVPAAQGEALDRLVADDRDALIALATVLGIELDPFEWSGAELCKLAWLLCAAPWLLAAALALSPLRMRGGGWRIAGAAMLFALSLGALLALLWCVPVRLLPARWSDLAFYEEQMAAWKVRPFRAPDVRDGLLSLVMLRTGLWCAVACIALWMERMWLGCGRSH